MGNRFVVRFGTFFVAACGTGEKLICSESTFQRREAKMRSKLLFVTLAATSILAVPVAAYAQGQTDSSGNAMGSRHVSHGTKKIHTSKMHTGTVGANMGAHRAKHSTPSSTQGDVGPGGNNNGTVTSPTK
jgi:uncharacterized low-complexity protein